MADYLIIDREMVVRLLNELETAAHRDGLLVALTDYVERSHQYKSDDRRSWVWRQTAVVTARFNAFIASGGSVKSPLGPLPVTKLNGEKIQVFEPSKEVMSEPEILDIQTDFSERYLRDWIQALPYSIPSNAAFQAGITSDVESNRQLGRVLDGLATLLIVKAAVHES